MGMKAVLEGAGADSFLLGCNSPMWRTLGLIHGMRVTGDINRSFMSFKAIARECFSRNWQNGVLWINDPDTLLLRNHTKTVVGPDGKEISVIDDITQDEFLFCAAYIAASDGMVLSGDKISAMQQQDIDILRKLLHPIGVAVEFNDTYEIGWAEIDKYRRRLFVFNNGEDEKKMKVTLLQNERVTDFWNGKGVPMVDGVLTITMYPHSAKVFDCVKK